MSTAELRKCLIDKILTVENEHLLKEACRLLDVSLKDSDVYKFSEEENNAINEAEAQIAKGKFYTNEEADNEIDEWLGK